MKNSFQDQIKKNTKSMESDGMLSGTIILNSNCSLLHPSISAASINSLLNALKIEDKKYVPNEL
jgi:hypothetical protein